MGTKPTKFTRFLNQDKNKSKPSFKSKSCSTIKEEEEHDTCKTRIRQNFITRRIQKLNKVITINVAKIVVK